MIFDFDEFESPLGRILFASDGKAICALDFAGYENRMDMLLERRYGAFQFRRGVDSVNLKPRLSEYFAGDAHALDQTPVQTHGTAFQEIVWSALRTIPVGATWSYGQLAEKIGRPTASRAVGHANSLNPVAIIVPCHRVVGASSALTGYAGGMQRKHWLLCHEGAIRETAQLPSVSATA